ncbi:hypothetical protein GCM10027280_37360 [Micromonospora polyrhachis]|uniref:Uncharacterized protein n=1 Tax=Micromonospora polyrhachis TaxID=1282883 RepID=A0A7W7SZ67_9ACTN|nr:hypothetical protein [Micromonospora polyrhachis]
MWGRPSGAPAPAQYIGRLLPVERSVQPTRDAITDDDLVAALKLYGLPVDQVPEVIVRPARVPVRSATLAVAARLMVPHPDPSQGGYDPIKRPAIRFDTEARAMHDPQPTSRTIWDNVY